MGRTQPDRTSRVEQAEPQQKVRKEEPKEHQNHHNHDTGKGGTKENIKKKHQFRPCTRLQGSALRVRHCRCTLRLWLAFVLPLTLAWFALPFAGTLVPTLVATDAIRKNLVRLWEITSRSRQ